MPRSPGAGPSPAGIAARDDEPLSSPVDAADDSTRQPRHRWRRRAEPLDQPVVLRVDDDPDHRRPAGTARRHRRGGQGGQGDPVCRPDLAVRVRSQALRAGGRLCLCLLPVYLVDAAIHLRRTADRVRPGPQGIRKRRGLARGVRRPRRARRRTGRRDIQRRPARLLHGLRRDPVVLLAARFALGTAGIIYLLYQREFRSEVLDVLRQ